MDRVQLSHEYETQLGCPPLIRINGKAPLDKEWSTGPRRDPDTWRERLEGHEGNVGLVCGDGLFVLDVDLYKPGARDALDELVDLGLPFDTVTCLTGQGGLHLYYRSPRAVVSRPLAGYEGIDVKGDGGCVVLPPSIHPDTKRAYEWEDDFGPDTRACATPPDDVLELFVGEAAAAYEAAGDLDERDEEAVNLLIDRFGAHSPHQRDKYVEITRLGKEHGVSATVGYLARGTTKVFSSNWAGLPAGQYSLGELRELAGVPGPTYTVKDAPRAALPDGYRLWEPGDDVIPEPVLARAAYYGPVGEYLHLVAGETEAHPAAVGGILLTHFGTLIGRRAAVQIGEHRHHCNLFVLVAGATSTGGKGTADNTAEPLVTAVEPHYFVKHAMGGFGSGEAIVEAIKDDDDEPTVKNRVINEAEFSALLRVASREKAILSEIIRQGFDYKPIRHRTKKGGALVSTGHHLAVIGSITPAELAACSEVTDVENGWLNRFLFLHSHLSSLLPFGGGIDAAARTRLGNKIGNVLAALNKKKQTRTVIDGVVTYRIARDTPTGEMWEPFYRQVRFGTGEGQQRSLTRRQHVHVPRLALIFAVLDEAAEIEPQHLEAAMAWSDYSVQSVHRLFSPAPDASHAGEFLRAVRAAMPDGLLYSQLDRGIAHNWPKGALVRARAALEAQHLIGVIKEPSGGRPRDRYVALGPAPRVDGLKG